MSLDRVSRSLLSIEVHECSLTDYCTCLRSRTRNQRSEDSEGRRRLVRNCQQVVLDHGYVWTRDDVHSKRCRRPAVQEIQQATMLFLPLACDDVSNVAFSRRLHLYSDCERAWTQVPACKLPTRSDSHPASRLQDGGSTDHPAVLRPAHSERHL
jgi:hypothetical protein